MYSYDVWDTLLGRWYYNPLTIFDEMGRCINFENFTAKRKAAEFATPNKTLAGIYEEFQRQNGISDYQRKQFIDYEVYMEANRSFRIEPVCLDAGSRDYIVVSDFYFDTKQLYDLLMYRELNPKNIYVSYDGKRAGNIWSNIVEPIEMHLGDNYESDFLSPKSHGIPAHQIVHTHLTTLERSIHEQVGFANLGSFKRLIRLQNPYDEPGAMRVWDESAVNIALLVSVAFYVKQLYVTHGFSNILFSDRDCIYLKQIFNALFPDIPSVSFHTSRSCYQLASPDFVKYVNSIYNDNSLIVDLQATGKSCYTFFNLALGKNPNFFTLIDADRANVPYPNKLSFVPWDDRTGNLTFSDRVEKLNYVNVGKVLDVDRYGQPLRQGQVYNPLIEVQARAVNLACMYIHNFGYQINITQDISPMLLKLLHFIENLTLEISQHVNHEEF